MKYAFWILFAVGFALCTPGIGRTLERVGSNWFALPMVLGSLLGVVAIGLAVAFAKGYRPALLPTDLHWVGALALLIAAKYVVGIAHGAVLAARG